MKQQFATRIALLTILAVVALQRNAQAQLLSPQAFSVSYFGETITHPGLKINAHLSLHEWEKANKKMPSLKKVRSLYLSPGVGFFSHKNYQTSVTATAELNHLRRNKRNNFTVFSVGGGWMTSSIPNVYQLNAQGNVEKIKHRDQYLVTTYGVAFGKNVTTLLKTPLDVFVKPSLMHATPGAAGGAWYLIVEVGVFRRW